MMNEPIALILDEGKWLTFSMGFAVLAVTWLLARRRDSTIPARRRILAAMNLFFGVTIGTMAFGHLLAVTIKLLLGTLEGSAAVFYAIGVALAVPSWWLIAHSHLLMTRDNDRGRATMGLNLWLTITLLLLGIHNLPLAAPGFLNIGYYHYSGRALGWVIVGLAVLANAGLFVASLIFLASGQSFEQFRGLE